MAASNWASSLVNLPSWSAFECDATTILTRFDTQTAQALCEHKTALEIVDVVSSHNTTSYSATHSAFSEAAKVSTYINGPRPELRILSIFRKHSLAPLLLSPDLLLQILHRHAISPHFLDLLAAFRVSDDLSGKGQALWSPLRIATDGYEINYQLRYMERNEHQHGQKWSERQVGVHHRFSANTPATFILINAAMSTKANSRIQSVLARPLDATRAVTSPLSLHLLVLTSYLDNWRDYLEELGTWCLKRENRFLTIGLKHPSLCFRELQELRDFESRLLSASAILQSSLSVIRELETCGLSMSAAKDDINQTSNRLDEHGLAAPDVQETWTLRVLRQKCFAFRRSVEIIQARTQVVLLLVSDGLAQQSQQTSNSIADSSRLLTMKSLHDSYVVKIVTVITVIYLPIQGVATLFGMNVTDLRDSDNRFHVADNWWLFLATAVPLALLTLGGLAWAMLLERRRQRNIR